MKLLLIETGNAREDPFAQCWYTPQQRRFAVPLLAMPVVAALTPPRFEVEIIDEKVQDLDLEAGCDLACFSFKTKDAKRTYRYAETFRKRGVPVILGGVHVMNIPEEAAQHADSIVVGEAEGIWPQVLEDFERGQLKKIYHAPKGGALEAAPIPRFDLLDNDRYCMHAIQTSRGCLVGCEFCPIQKMNGGTSRHKSVGRVLAEVEAVRKIDPHKMIFFVDEMFCGGEAGYQKELLAALRRKQIEFFCITDFKVINPDYIQDLARSGCRKLSINLPGTCLPQEVKAIRAIQRLGIEVWGFFMFGFSFHDGSVFRKVEHFARDCGMKNLTLTVMSPFPNTPMDRQITARNAYRSKDWDLYDQCHVTYEPERMTAEELEAGFLGTWKALEERLYFEEADFSKARPWRRKLHRAWGTTTLSVEYGLRRLLGTKDEPVDLQSIVGKPKVEVSVTTHNTMGGYHAKN